MSDPTVLFMCSECGGSFDVENAEAYPAALVSECCENEVCPHCPKRPNGGLTVRVEDDALVIRCPLEVLAFATEECSRLATYDDERRNAQGAGARRSSMGKGCGSRA
jgi:hypothetical protein